MAKHSPKFHYPLDIELATNPIAEVWLTIRWELESGEPPEFKRDPNFDLALGRFADRVKDQFGVPVERAEVRIPPEMIPYRVRYQFRPQADGWPLLQLGPGVASVNFNEGYTWKEFREMSLYLRSKLIEVYGEKKLNTESISLQYRNAVPFKYSSRNLAEFLGSDLNTLIRVPEYIPGDAATTGNISGMNLILSYQLRKPEGIGVLKIVTGTKKVENVSPDPEHIIVEIEVSSKRDDAPTLGDEGQFNDWLEGAHNVAHDWFLSLIEGDLRRQFEEGEK